MNARLERKLRLLARIVAGSVIAAIGFVLARGYTAPSALVVGISYALFVGDEVIVTWPENVGAIDCRPLRCFMAMREELSRASGQLEGEFGAAPRIRGSLHFGPVIVGEIGDVKRAIVFNGDVMNTAARLEELSRSVEGGFLAASLHRLAILDLTRFLDASRSPLRLKTL
jgi:adenylate cyclase